MDAPQQSEREARATYEERQKTWVRVLRGLDRNYPEPDPFDTYEQWQQFSQHDLAAMTIDALKKDRRLANYRLAVYEKYQRDPSFWLTERVQRVDDELQRRKDHVE